LLYLLFQVVSIPDREVLAFNLKREYFEREIEQQVQIQKKPVSAKRQQEGNHIIFLQLKCHLSVISHVTLAYICKLQVMLAVDAFFKKLIGQLLLLENGLCKRCVKGHNFLKRSVLNE
jgi:hypothetical protein